MTTLVFGHKSPDTDSTGSPLIWAWYLSEIRKTPAEAKLLGAPNTEAAFVCKRWGFEEPAIIEDVSETDTVVIVDTNNPAELPASINSANVVQIIDHHKLVGGLETAGPIDITIKPLACTATIMHNLMGENATKMPDPIKGLMLSCILSDTLEFRSPTTTDQDRELAESLANLETTAPQIILDRQASIMASMPAVASEDGVDDVLLFVVDILQEQATLFVPNDTVKTVAEKSFDATVTGDSVVLPGIMSRKKQIIPNLSAALTT